MYAAGSIFLNQREKDHFPLPGLIRAQAPSSDGDFIPALISADQEMVPLDTSTQQQKFLLPARGWRAPTFQPPAPH